MKSCHLRSCGWEQCLLQSRATTAFTWKQCSIPTRPKESQPVAVFLFFLSQVSLLHSTFLGFLVLRCPYRTPLELKSQSFLVPTYCSHSIISDPTWWASLRAPLLVRSPKRTMAVCHSHPNDRLIQIRDYIRVAETVSALGPILTLPPFLQASFILIHLFGDSVDSHRQANGFVNGLQLSLRLVLLVEQMDP